MLYCLIGKSSTGKDTILKKLLESNDYTLESMISYTTRPIRENEVNGVEYYFVDEKKRDELKKKGKIIELRRYNTCFGTWDYFTVDDDKIKIKYKHYIVIGTLESYEKIRDYYGEEYVCPLYIEVEDGLRLQRALNRERVQKHPKYNELCRRFLADDEDYSKDKLEALEIKKVFDNYSIEDTVNQILRYIKKQYWFRY